MVWVRPGECLLGDDGQYGNPRHRCYLDGYWIYKSPVTVGQYRAFCNASRRRMPPAPYGGWMDSRPIVNVTWNDALAYARWAGVTLPTEAQWEKAARGDQGQRYPWGDGWDLDRLWCSSDRDVRTTAAPAGSYPEGASPCGALDMAGNVKQWCADYYSPGYPEHAPHRNPSGPEQSDRRAVRGSSFNEYYDRAFVSSRREGEPPGDAVSDTGFRCATPVYAP
jgi:formylglycine-generating enzyme required for sulfatase activity